MKFKHIKTFESYVDNIDNLSRYEKIKSLNDNKPIIVYRGTHKSGKNFYQGDKPLPFTYYSLTKEKAEYYGDLNVYIFNENSKNIKTFKGNDLFDKFGFNSDFENKDVYDILINEGYSAIINKGDELIVFDNSLIKKLNK